MSDAIKLEVGPASVTLLASGTIGPRGLDGPAGPAGEDGPAGPAGPQGTAGPAGGVTSVNTRTGAVTGLAESADLAAVEAAAEAYADAAVAALVDASPGALDTLNELAAALGDDPNFAATVNTAIAARLTEAQGDVRYRLLSAALVNADIAAGAGIALSKLATDPLDRANHTGTQLATTVSDFAAAVRTNRLDQMAAPIAAVAANGQKITALAAATVDGDALRYEQRAVAGTTVGTFAAGDDPRFAAVVTKALYDANTVLAANADDTPLALAVPASTFLGRKAAGNIAAMTVAEVVALLAGTGADTLAAGNDARFTTVVANRQTANYVLVLADAAKVIEMNLAGANTLTVPPNSTVAFPVGTVIELVQWGVGQTTITSGAGVTIRSSGAKLKTGAQYAQASLRKVAADEWIAAGDLVA